MTFATVIHSLVTFFKEINFWYLTVFLFKKPIFVKQQHGSGGGSEMPMGGSRDGHFPMDSSGMHHYQQQQHHGGPPSYPPMLHGQQQQQQQQQQQNKGGNDDNVEVMSTDSSSSSSTDSN